MAQSDKDKIYCVGEEGALGHPKVYLEFDAEGKVTCPYCDKLYQNS